MNDMDHQKLYYPAKYIQATVPFVWIGFIGAISFMEAWVKFIPDDVSFLVGLSIGQVVFAALNKVELIAAIILAAAILYGKELVWKRDIFFIIAVSILFLQSLWVLPYLSARIDIYRAGNTPPPSSIHIYFVVMEVLKTFALLMYGIKHLSIWKT